LKILKTFFCQDQDQDQDQDFYLKTKTKTLGLKTKTKTKTLFFVLEAPRDQDFGLEDYITGCGPLEEPGKKKPSKHL